MDNLDIFPTGGAMKFLNLLMWVGQFGFSVIFPTVFFLILAVWLQNKFGLGLWIVVLFGILGVLTSISTALCTVRHRMVKFKTAMTLPQTAPRRMRPGSKVPMPN